MTKFYPLKVSEIKKETSDTVSIVFDLPHELENKFKFIQGQYLTLETSINGQKVRRAYSLCSSANSGVLRVAVKKVENGLFSVFATEHLKVGDVLDVMPPMGSFYTPLDKNNKKNYLAVAAGSGITPILSILKTTLETEPNSTFTLLFVNKDSQNIIFKEELEELKNGYLNRFSLFHFFTREKTEFDLFNGRLNKSKMEKLLDKSIDVNSLDDCFFCGPEDLINEMQNVFRDHGMPLDHLHAELFTKKNIKTMKTKSNDTPVSTNGHEITIIMDGDEFKFTMKDNSDFIIDAAIEEDIDVPYSCQAGVCSTCKAKVVEGEVSMSEDHTLDDDEVEAGFVLSCICTPKSEKVTLDYDVL